VSEPLRHLMLPAHPAATDPSFSMAKARRRAEATVAICLLPPLHNYYGVIV